MCGIYSCWDHRCVSPSFHHHLAMVAGLVVGCFGHSDIPEGGHFSGGQIQPSSQLPWSAGPLYLACGELDYHGVERTSSLITESK